MSSGLHWIDCLIVAFYALGVLGLGWFYARRQVSSEEYFVGNRAVPPILIGISLFATLLSTITYLSSPGEIIQHGPVILAGVFSIPIAYVIVGYWLIPVFMRYRLTSAYELLEWKLGLSVRLTGATMFILLRLTWMAVLLNFAANALLVMFGWEGHWLLAVTAAVGAVALAVRYAPWWLNTEVLRPGSLQRRRMVDATGAAENEVPAIRRDVFDQLPENVQPLYEHWLGE